MPDASDNPHAANAYEVGAILSHSWGYDQTNIDWFVIVARTDKPSGTWLTLHELFTADKTETGFMTGTCLPGAVNPNGRKLRRKLAIEKGCEFGCRIERSYGWCSLWDGKPERWSSYA